MVTPKKVLLFIHHPVLKTDSAVDKKYPLHGREKIKEALHNHKSEVYIFSGHCHTVDERTDENINCAIECKAFLDFYQFSLTIEVFNFII